MDKKITIEKIALKLRSDIYCNLITCKNCELGEVNTCCKEYQQAIKIVNSEGGADD